LEALQVPNIGQAATGTSYSYKASLIGSAHRFELTGEGLSWHVSGRSGLWRVTDIAAVRLSFRPVTMQPRRFRADIGHAGGARIAVLSTTWTTVTLMAPQDRDYRAFILELHRRLKEAGSKAELVGGLRPGLYQAGLALLAIVTVSMSGLLIRALSTGEWAGALFLLGFAALFGWQIGGFIRRNRPRRYGFDDVPEELLPNDVENVER
jgi:hypothetical protein